MARDGEGRFWLTRIVFLRCLAAIYFVAFLVALDQNGPLIGEDGLLPATLYMQRLRRQFGEGNWLVHPTLFWFVEPTSAALRAVALCGLALAACVVALGAANMLVMAALWALYFSLVSVGQRWYSFGWESQLLETGFLAIWLCPLLSLAQMPRRTPAPLLAVWGYRWLIFRIMLGAGLIKIRGDDCWRDLTCMHYFYQTMPVPNPLTHVLHASPGWFHSLEVLVNHAVELVVPWFVFMPRGWRCAHGVVQIGFQLILISSGNLSFLNWLTILPSIWCFDDAHLGPLLFSRAQQGRAQRAQTGGGEPWLARRAVLAAVGALLAFLSWPVVLNLLSSSQAMNSSFNQFQLVNTYGAFGSVTKVRHEVVLEGTDSADAFAPDAAWREFEFKCKPGAVDRRPCLISPYHYRLDWLMWFAAFSDYGSHPWLVHLGVKLLQGDEGARSLIAHDPFAAAGAPPPRYIRAKLYEYRFAPAFAGGTAWWEREDTGRQYMPPLSLDNPSVEEFLNATVLAP